MWGHLAAAPRRCLFASDDGGRQEGVQPGGVVEPGAVVGDGGGGGSPPLLLPLPALSHCAPTPALTHFLNR